MLLGKCPYCDDGEIEVRKKDVRGKKVELYACSNASWTTEDGEFFELTSTSKCGFKIWQNTLLTSALSHKINILKSRIP